MPSEPGGIDRGVRRVIRSAFHRRRRLGLARVPGRLLADPLADPLTDLLGGRPGGRPRGHDLAGRGRRAVRGGGRGPGLGLRLMGGG